MESLDIHDSIYIVFAEINAPENYMYSPFEKSRLLAGAYSGVGVYLGGYSNPYLV